MTSAVPAVLLAAELAVTGMVLAGPASVWLAGASWPLRSPRAALVLWQAVCLGAGISLIGALMVLAISPLGHTVLGGVLVGLGNLWQGRPFDGLSGWQIACLVLGVAGTIALLVVLLRCLYLAIKRRRTHRMLIDVLSRPGALPTAPGLLYGVRVLDHPSAVAYTVPGWHSRVVMSAGLLDLLTPQELSAVLEHERAHLRSRHDLLILPFQAWAAALGAVPGVRHSRIAVAELAEMLADDLAARRSGPKVLACALAKVALAAGPTGTDPAAELSVPASTGQLAGAKVTRRVRRLLEPQPLPVLVTALIYLQAAALVLAPLVGEWIGWA